MRRSGSCSGSLQVTVTNLQRTIPINVIGLTRFAVGAARFCLQIRKSKPTDLTRLTEILVLLVSDRRMAGLHRQFLGRSGSTDVLTFQHGEIFISAETAQRNAGRFRNKLGRELRLYIVHGLLHLHGFDDQDPASSRKMRKVQERILAQAGALN